MTKPWLRIIMPGLLNSHFYRVFRSIPNSRREDLEIYEEPGTLLPFCLQFRSRIIRAATLTVVLNFRKQVEQLLYAGRLIRCRPLLDVVIFLGHSFCIMKFLIVPSKVIVVLHIFIWEKQELNESCFLQNINLVRIQFQCYNQNTMKDFEYESE